MLEWCMAHPWMTFFIVLTALDVAGKVVSNVVAATSNIVCMRMHKVGLEVRENTEKGELDARTL